MISDTSDDDAAAPPAPEPLADLADLVLAVARDLHQHPVPADVVPLTTTEASVLRSIDRMPAASPSVLARRTALQRSNLSAALRSLEARGLIRRDRPTHDGRGVELHVTELGHQNATRIRAAWAARVRTALDGDHTDVDAGLRLLTRIEEGLLRGEA